jgi:hypothetical protein
MLENVIHLTLHNPIRAVTGLLIGFSIIFWAGLFFMAFYFLLCKRFPGHYLLGSRISGSFVLFFEDTPMRTTSTYTRNTVCSPKCL